MIYLSLEIRIIHLVYICSITFFFFRLNQIHSRDKNAEYGTASIRLRSRTQYERTVRHTMWTNPRKTESRMHSFLSSAVLAALRRDWFCVGRALSLSLSISLYFSFLRHSSARNVCDCVRPAVRHTVYE